nr:ribonuclease H-like domain-containing protein [Tanacetum cinerariifolium]
TFGGNKATKKTKKNKLKQQYGNFKAKGSETLLQTFNRLQVIVSHLVMDVEIERDDLNQNFLTSLVPEWLMYTIVWRNRNDLNTLSLDDVYNHLKVYEPKVQNKSESNSHIMAFFSSANTSSGIGEDNTVSIPTASTQVSPASANVAYSSISHDTMGHFSRECRAPRSQDRGRRENYKQGSKEVELAPKALKAIDRVGWDWSYMVIEEENHALDTVMFLPPTQVYSPPKKDMSWTELLEFADDTITDYNRPSPSIESNSSDLQNSTSSVSEHGESSKSIISKPMIKFVKAVDCAKVKTNKVEDARKPSIKYAGMPFQGKSAVRTQFRVPRVSTVFKKFPTVDTKFSTAKSSFTAGLGNKEKAVKASACLIWRPKQNTTDKGPNSNSGNSQNNIDDKGYWDSGYSQHMTGNISYRSDYEPYDGGYVSFGQGGGKITGKGIIKTGKLEFENRFKLKDDTNVLLRTPRQHNMYSIDLYNILPHKDLTCLVVKASANESMLWHRRLGHLNVKTMNTLVRHNLVKGLPSKFFKNDHTCVACLKGKQHKASCKTKLVNLVSKPLHTLHMDLFGPTSISSLNHKWYCLDVTHDFSRFTWTFFLKTNDETSGILRNFITEIENLKDLKVKIIRCDNEGNPHNNIDDKGYWDSGCSRHMTRNISYLSEYEPYDRGYVSFGHRGGKITCKGIIKTGTSFTNISSTKDAASQGVKKDVSSLRYIAFPNWFHEAHIESSNSDAQDACNADAPEGSGNFNPTATSKSPPAEQMESLTVESVIPTGSSPVPTACLETSPETSSGSRLILKRVSSKDETPSLDNILTLSNSPTPTPRIHKDHPKSQIIGPVDTPVQTRHKSKEMEEHSFIATIHQNTTHDLLQFCLFLCFLSQEEPKKIFDALKDLCWVEAMQEEILQFKIQNVWILVDCPKGVRPIGTKWVLKNKKDKKGIVIRNKARLVGQGHTQEEGIDYEEVFAPIARIEAVQIFLAYASFMGFTDPEFLDRVYKDGVFLSQDKYVGDILKKFGYSGVRLANTPMDKENPWGKDGPSKDVELHLYRSMIGSLMHLTASIPDIMFAVCACARHQVTPKECHMHTVKRIFRYLKGHPKLGLWYPKESPFDLVAYSDSDYGGATQDRKSTTKGCQFLRRRLISWQCKKQTIMAISTTEAEYVAAASGYGQVLWIQNQLLDYGEVPILSCEYWNV